MAKTRPRQTPLSPQELQARSVKLKHSIADKFIFHGYPEIARQLHACEETEVLAACTHCGASWYIINHCRQRVCPLCSYKIARKRGTYLLAMTAHMQHPKLLTLTLPLWTSVPQLGIKHLRHCFNLIRGRAFFRAVAGGAYQIELKQKPEGWHIHLHAILDAPFIPYQQIFTAWSQITHNPVPQVDIRAATSLAARTYAAKYAAKSAAFFDGETDPVAWYQATKGQRLFTTFGKWFNFKLQDVPQTNSTEPFQAVCPRCGKAKTTFLARDGPYMYGFDVWRTISDAIVNGQDLERPLQPKQPTNVTQQPQPMEAAL